MKRWLARLFGAAPAAPVDRTPSPSNVPSPDVPLIPAVNEQPALDLDLAFFHWLAGPHIAGAAGGETLVLDELARLPAADQRKPLKDGYARVLSRRFPC